MTYCTTDELVLRTGSTLPNNVLRAVIADADREIDAYLLQYSLSGAGSGACMSASLELSKAGLLDRGRLDGTQPDSSTEGDVSATYQIEAAIKRHRATAFGLLDQYVASQQTRPRRHYVAKVNG